MVYVREGGAVASPCAAQPFSGRRHGTLITRAALGQGARGLRLGWGRSLLFTLLGLFRHFKSMCKHLGSKFKWESLNKSEAESSKPQHLIGSHYICCGKDR